MAKNNEGIRIGMFGNSGSGKTHFAQHLTKDVARLIVFDPKHTYHKRKDLNYFVTSSIGELLEVLRDNWDTGFRIVFEANLAHARGQLADICQLLIHLQKPFMRGEGGEMLTLIIEEIQVGAPNPLGKEGEQFIYAMSMLREGGVNIIGATQRPQLVATTFRELLSRSYFFKPSGIKAATAMAEVGTGEDDLRDAILNLAPYHFVIYDDGLWELGTPVPA